LVKGENIENCISGEKRRKGNVKRAAFPNGKGRGFAIKVGFRFLGLEGGIRIKHILEEKKGW